MKNKRTDEAISSVVIDGDISFAAKRSPAGAVDFFLLRLIMAVVTALSTISMTCSFLNSRHYSFSAVYPGITAVFVILAITAAASNNKTLRAIGIGSVTAPFFVFIIKWETVFHGAVGAAYYYIEKAKKGSDENYFEDLFSKLDGTLLPPDDCITVFLMFMGLVIGFIIGVAYLHKLDFPLLFLGTFPFFMLGLYQGFEPPLFTVIFIVISWVSMLSLSIINHTTNKAGVKNTFAIHRRKKAFYFTSRTLKQKFFSHYLMNLLTVFGLVFFGAFLFNSFTDNRRPKAFDEWRRTIAHKFEDLTEKISNMLDINNGRNVKNDDNVGGMNNGSLGNVGELDFKEDTLLRLTVDKAPTYPIYLRRYIAGRYVPVGNRWDQEKPRGDLPADSETLTNYSYRSIDRLGDAELKARMKNRIHIDVEIEDEDLLYFPYDAVLDGEYGRVNGGDGSIRTNYGEYDIEFYDTSQLPEKGSSAAANAEWLFTELYRSDNYNDLDPAYSSFVYENYYSRETGSITPLVQDTAKQIEYNYGTFNSDSPLGALQAANSIKQFFNAYGFKYKTDPGTTPDGKDFIDTFLETKEGYCVYFASAGVQLMRAMGYPARYVEGFIATPSEFNKDKEAELTDSSAHAWCEVFIETVGWVPVEFTPSYGNSVNPNLDPEKTYTTTTIPSATTTTTTTTTPAPVTSVQTSISGSMNTSASTTSEITTTTKKSASGGSGSGKGSDDNGDGDSGEGSRKTMSQAVKILLFYIAIVLVILVILILRRKRRLGVIRRRTTDADRTSATTYIYRYYLRYLELIDIRESGNIPDEKQAAKLIAICEERGLEELRHDISELSELAIKACMSGTEITEEEYGAAMAALEKLRRDTVLPRLTLLGRLNARWISCLY